MKTLLRSRCGVSLEPEFLTLYDPYRVIVDRWRVDDTDRSKALAALNDACPPPDVKAAQLLALRLIAKTKQRKESVEMGAVRQSEFVMVLQDYPESLCEHVVSDWDKREPPQSDFTPSCAELRRALEDAGQAFVLLRASLMTRET